MNTFQKEIYKTVDILIDKKLEHIQYDQTVRGKVVAVRQEDCDVEINGMIYTCKYHTSVQTDDIVYVTIPSNNAIDRYVAAVVGKLLGGGSMGNLDGGEPHSVFGGMDAIDGGGVSGS